MSKINKKSNIILTFCIPSYNYNIHTYSLIKDILKYPNDDIEVIVTDNCSTDNTIELLESINDNRLKVFKNKENLGAVGNFRECLKYSQGKYSYTYIARDKIDSKKIGNLVNFLRKADYVYINNHRDNGLDKEYIEKESLNKFAYKSWHPTGHIFKTEIIKKILKRTENCEYINNSIFPHDYWIVESCLLGNSYVYSNILKVEHDLNYFTTTKSKFSKNDIRLESAVWFSFENQFEETKRKFMHLKDINENYKITNFLFRKIYIYQLLAMTVVLKKRLHNTVGCIHYGINERKVTMKEMISNAKCLNEYTYKWILEENIKLNIINKVFVKLYRFIIFAYSIREKF